MCKITNYLARAFLNLHRWHKTAFSGTTVVSIGFSSWLKPFLAKAKVAALHFVALATGGPVAGSAALSERLLPLRAVVAEALASMAPRRTVAVLGAAVA